MKAFFILIITLSFSLIAFGQADSLARPDDSVGRGFTNKAEAKNLTVNGLKEGKWVEYMDMNANIINTNAKNILLDTGHYQLAIYQAGKPNGLLKVYLGGHILYETPYSNGKINGVYKEYAYTGQLEREVNYSNGQVNGDEREYYDTGTAEFIGKHGSVKYLHKSNLIMKYEYTFKSGKLDGLSIDYYESGVEKDEMFYVRGNLKNEKHFDENGKLRSETDYTHNSMGITVNYDKNGKKIK